MAIKIKETQLQKLEPYALENYINELMVHCDESYPHLRKTMGESNLMKVILAVYVKAREEEALQEKLLCLGF